LRPAIGIYLYFIAIVLLAGCKTEKTPRASVISIKDDIGVELKIDTHPKRIISLAPNVTEALYSIGADSLIAGVTDFCDFPPKAKLKKSIGNYLSPDFETILSLKPDLAIMYVTNSSGPAYKTLSDNGIKIFATNPQDINGIKKMISDFGYITGRKLSADSVNNLIDLELSMKAGNIKSDSTFIIISVNPLMTASGKTFVSQLIEVAGFSNIFGGLAIEYPVISAEDLLRKNPAVMIFPTDTTDLRKSDESISELRKSAGSAVDKARLIFVDDDIMFRPGPRIIEALRVLRMKKVQSAK
jgi:iron complex transport system substrate-binding protein